ncbi:MAG: hypothetical protein HY718_02590, partial [Planctomycetes bacterium]|nr:hypothetical protein [Planctomycetota bacterium]
MGKATGWVRISCSIGLVLGVWILPATGQFERIVVASKAENGQVSVLTGSLGPQVSISGLGGQVVLGVQSDNSIITGTDDGAGNGGFNKRDPLTLAVIPGSGGGGLGAPVRTIAVFSNDSVFIGSGNGTNNQVRNADLTAIIAGGGPALFGDEGLPDSVVQSDDDLIFIYSNSALAVDQQGRLRRDPLGSLGLTGPDENLGAAGGVPILGVAVAVQSDDTIVVARDDRYVELRHGTTLSPDLGGFTRSAGAFGADITALGVLSDGRVVIGTSDGEIQVRSSDLQTPLVSQGGFGAISALAVQADDDIVVGNQAGEVRVLDPST